MDRTMPRFVYRTRINSATARAFTMAALLLLFVGLQLSCGGGSGGGIGTGGGTGGTTGGTSGSTTGGNVANACGENFQDPNCRTLSFGGVTRAYLLHVPTNFQPNSSALVVGLHGSHGSGLEMSQNTDLNSTADKNGFAVAYPYSLVSPGAGFTEWNEFFNQSYGSNPPDDVGFIRQVITTLQAELHPDPKRIYVTGLSNGGFMAHRVGIQLSDMVAAIGVVEGTVVSPGLIQDVPAPLGPVSVLIVHGDEDSTVLYCGQPVVASQEETFNYWTGPSANSCSIFDTSAPLCDSQRNITSVLEKDATGCRGSSEVRFYKLIGGQHLWYNVAMNVPGQTPFNPKFDSTTGVTTNDILWNFFASHPKP
ncbi:MAG TPA: PHB depolymerase family esterase [Terriglobales bacterium]